MSYQVLARKWRPQHFSRLVGQDHVKTALGNALSNNRLHHAYLFTGTRGVGKTTIARIFAKSLNCEQGVTATPCGQCSACTEIDAGNFVDLLEIDAASRTKVEDTRDLLDNVQYAPSRGRFKVYLIDEVHMLSKHSFNALLKTLEEPPPHVKFLLATTDPQKLPVTVLSRCLQFNLLALSPAQIEQHLAYVLNEEHISFEQAALALLSRAAKGSLRDSLSLTDQAIAQTNGNITLEAVRTMLGLLEQSWAQQLLQAVINQDITQLQQQLAALVQQQSNFAQVLDDMLSLLHLAALAQFSPQAAAFSQQPAFVQTLADSLAPAQIQLYYQLLISGKKELPYAPDPLTGLEMALLRAMAFVPEGKTAVAAPTSGVVMPAMSSLTPSSPVAQHQPTQAVQAFAAQHGPNTAESGAVTQSEVSQRVNQTKAGQNTDTSTAAITANDELQLDEATARIMARRGVQLTAPMGGKAVVVNPTDPSPSTPIQQEPNGVTPEASAPKKFERPKAPEQPASEYTLAPEQNDNAYDDRLVAEDTGIADDTENADCAAYAAVSDALWQQYEQDAPANVDALLPFDGSIDEQNFSVRFAAQVDAWAARVETLDTGGLSRLFLLNAAAEQNGNQLTLNVAQSQQHLDSPAFRTKLQQVLEASFNQPLEVVIQYQPEVTQSPLAIQQRIVQERLVYVTRLLQQDEKVQQLQQLFNAQLLTDTIVVH
ncbi:DNA polymerase III subunit gamma/tau [Rheinheimera fenheensis]|uniref:DNA polymerase III subunit gamma/tau n=1 Tax=Rheinheimera fenheensis TaxID=3152295 RepID=UPI0032606167